MTLPTPDEGQPSHGLGIGVVEIDGGQGRLIGHDGKDFSYRANFSCLKNTGITIALCANSTGNPESDTVLKQLFDQVLARVQRALSLRWPICKGSTSE